MKLRIIGLTLAVALLGGCTDADWDSAMATVGMGDSPGGDPPPPPAPAAPQTVAPVAQADTNEAWCREVAAYERQGAAGMGFDAATQQHQYALRYNQCMRYSTGKPQ
jgi:hypothetical protein